MDSFDWNPNARPTIIRCGRFPLADRAYRTLYLSHEFHAVHLYQYAGTWRADDHVFDLRPGDLTLTPMGLHSRYDLPRPGFHLCAHFAFARQRRGRQPLVRLPLHLRLEEHRVFVTELFDGMLRLFRDRHTKAHAQLAQETAEQLLQTLLAYLRLITAQETPRRTRPVVRAARAVQRVVEMLESNLADDLSVPQLADSVGLSQDYLAKVFRKKFGVTLPRYRLLRRIEMAEWLLTGTGLSVTAIAHKCGFRDAQHLNKQFRLLRGCCPSALREL